MRIWLEHHPPLDEAEEDAAAASAEARFERFLELVAHGLRGGVTLSAGLNSSDAPSEDAPGGQDHLNGA